MLQLQGCGAEDFYVPVVSVPSVLPVYQHKSIEKPRVVAGQEAWDDP
jgi:hypothetical protein